MLNFKLAAGCLPVEEKEKQEILQDISFVLESNVLVLLKCPHLLLSCIRNASNAVRETVLIPHVSAPWLEWNTHVIFPDPEIGNMHCFATSSDKKTVAGAKGRSLLFFDASTAETVRGPFKISRDTIDIIDQLEFSPDGKFLFFGRLDKWFSVERGCVEDFSQFSGNSHIYKWGVFTRDGNCIVVKRNRSYNPITCQSESCLVNLPALWAVKEIEHSRDHEMTVCFNRQQVRCNKSMTGVQITRLLECLRLGRILNRSRKTPLVIMRLVLTVLD
ncbi:hypothetical protein OS493_037549 [Desmophyllum pertusum]|uniref:Uncharacterized protein n=1 Tax=Desmophyllum pertusum TaxID=174260 RepID=A0A9W9Z6N2_9CNID|nr:hypothetical protein OS493_037549 [Desmophyllum pertusum]